ncbi:unnamed protein product, partial [Anisakis simplex]|uniref:Uncharacterized protein n=1 Tax=Anisakis simplex TaxID=6269 RepID=A0A0M3J5K4_ANISI
MSAENGTTTASLLRHSPFMSMFGRKKRINGTKSAEDMKGVASALTANDRTTTTTTTMNGSAKPTQNGGDFVAGDTFIDSDHYDSTRRGQHQLNSNLHQSAGNQDCFAAVDEPYNNTCPQYSQYPQQSVSSSPSTFAEKIRHHKNSRSKLHSRDSKSEARPGSVPAESSTLPNLAAVSAGKKDLADRNQLRRQQKAFSADAVYSLEPLYLMEALETLAEDQPLVARSIPKHARVDTSGFAKRSLDNCLFDSTVYDNMLCDSLK